MTGSEVFCAEFIENDGARSSVVADEADAAGGLHLRDEGIGKAGVGGKRNLEGSSGNLPVSGHGVFPRRSFGEAAVGKISRIVRRAAGGEVFTGD